MSTKGTQEKDVTKVSLSQKFSDFIMKNRVVIVSALIAIFCIIISLVVYTAILEHKNSVAFETVETVLSDWESARSAADQSGLSVKEDDLIKKLQKIAISNKHSYAGARAYMTIAEVYFSRKDWKNAQENYLFAAKSASKVYTNGLNYYNAAVCADELGNYDDAIKYFELTIASEAFPLKSRALFNIGRIEEQRSNSDAAIVAYQKLAEKYPDDEWTQISKSRIIALQIK